MTIEILKIDQDGDLVIFAIEFKFGGFCIMFDRHFRKFHASIFNANKAIAWI
jgi:hypothetical protein